MLDVWGTTPFQITAAGISGTQFIPFNNGSNNYGLQIKGSSGSTYFSFSNAGPGVAIGTSYIATLPPANGLLVQGNVGIGTTSPGSKLQVNGGAAIGYAASTVAPTNGLVVAGNVGIGTTNPTVALTVSGAIGAFANSSGNHELFHLAAGSALAGTGANSYLYAGNYDAGAASGSYAYVGGWDSRAAAIPLVLQSSGGNVGIGTTAADQLLTVAGRIESKGVSPEVWLYDTGATLPNGLWRFIGNSAGLFQLQQNTTAAGDFSSGSVRVVVDTSGDVGIGTTSPGSKLQVNGGAAIGYSTSTVAPTNGLAVAGTVGIGTTTTPTGVTESVNGPVQVAGTGSEPCTAAQVGTMRYNPTGQYFEICTP